MFFWLIVVYSKDEMMSGLDLDLEVVDGCLEVGVGVGMGVEAGVGLGTGFFFTLGIRVGSGFGFLIGCFI